jgi:glycerol-3-phosphate acyltransferase PlsX
VILYGPPPRSRTSNGVEVVDAPLSIAKERDPARAVRLPGLDRAAVRAVAAGEADALVSGGSTGAALAIAVQLQAGARRAPARVAIIVPVPRAVPLLDAGANVEVRPEHLVQFAHMGAAFMEAVMGVSAPRVALLSNGTEDTKGTEIVLAAHAALAGMPGFAGNVEGFAIGTGAADVIVADGFTGNVALKVIEGTSAALLGAVRERRCRRRAKLGGLLLKPRATRAARRDRPRGAGRRRPAQLRWLAVVPHGSFGARASRARSRSPRAGARGRRRAHARAPGGRGALRRPRGRPRRPQRA